MLARDPVKRLTAAALLHHPWMKVNGVATDEVITPEVLNRLRNFGNMNKLKKEALKVCVCLGVGSHATHCLLRTPSQQYTGHREEPSPE